MSHHKLRSARLVAFPSLSRSNHRITSEESDEYNCIAWAAGENTAWWWPNQYWPPDALRDDADIQSFIDAFATRGYTVCDDGTLEEGYEKIAIYVHPIEGPSHAALQLPSGRWTSKLGKWQDIEHNSERDLEGLLPYCYGEVRTYMRRPRAM